jgi:hypothetical protein
VPARTIKGQTYGTATQQLEAQHAVPMSAPQQPGTPMPAFPEGGVPAGGMGDLLGPDDRPEALGFVNPELDATRRDFQALQQYVPAFMFHASRAGASPSYVAWVQQLLAGA